MNFISDAFKSKIENVKNNFQLTAGEFPQEADRKSPEFKIIEEIDVGHSIRKQILFNSEKEDWVRAYLFIPKNTSGKHPGMLCLHQTNGKSGCEEPAGISGLVTLKYGLELAERGYVTLMPDYPYFGTNNTNPYDLGYKSNTMKGIWNHIRAIDLLESLPEVESSKLGCIGHSLGGHNTIFVTLFDERIKVAVTSCGLCALREYVKTNGGNLWGWAQDRYMPLIEKNFKNDPELMPWDFPEMVSAIAPRAIFINAPLHDSNMNYPGNKIIIENALLVFKELKAENQFFFVNPDAEHSFPDETRQQAYAFIDSKLT